MGNTEVDFTREDARREFKDLRDDAKKQHEDMLAAFKDLGKELKDAVGKKDGNGNSWVSYVALVSILIMAVTPSFLMSKDASDGVDVIEAHMREDDVSGNFEKISGKIDVLTERIKSLEPNKTGELGILIERLKEALKE